MVDSVSVRFKNASVSKKMPLNIRFCSGRVAIVNFSFARLDSKIAWNQARRGAGEGWARLGEDRARTGRGPGEERARPGEAEGVQGCERAREENARGWRAWERKPGKVKFTRWMGCNSSWRFWIDFPRFQFNSDWSHFCASRCGNSDDSWPASLRIVRFAIQDSVPLRA